MTQGDFEEGGESTPTPRERAAKIQEDILAIGGEALDQAHELGDRALRAGRAGADYARRAGASTGSFVASNALPLSLIGAGVGMLAWSLRKQSQRKVELDLLFDDSFDEELEGTYPIRAREEISVGAESGETLAGSARHTAQQAKESIGALGHRASELAGRASDRASELAGRASDRASALAGRASDRASALTHRAAERVDIVRSRVNDAATHLNERGHELSHEARERIRLARLRSRDFADENPLLVGAVALAAGVSVGLLLPATQPENRLLGQTRDRLLGDARGVLDEARGVLDETRITAREAAGQVTQRAREAAQELRSKRTDPSISH